MFLKTYFSEQIGGAIRHLSEQDARFRVELPGQGYHHALKFVETIVDLAIEGPEKGRIQDFALLLDISSNNIQRDRLEEFVRDMLVTDRIFTDDSSQLAWMAPELASYREIFGTKTHLDGTTAMRVNLSNRFYTPKHESQEERLGETARRKFRKALENYLLIPVALIKDLPPDEEA